MGSVTYVPQEMNILIVAETIISREYPNGMDATQVDQFKTSFVCFILGYFLIACSNANHGAKDFWGSLLTPNEIPSYNFCSAAIDEIMNAARKAQNELKTKKSIKYVSSCPLLLQVSNLIQISTMHIHFFLSSSLSFDNSMKLIVLLS